MTPMSATAPDTAAPPVVKQAPVVEISGLWSVFHTAGVDVVVHKDLNLTVPHGEMLAIVGGSGSGKTVLLRQILGLQTPSRGSVTVLGKPAAVLGAKGAASRVGMLFQHGALFSAFTVLENIAFPLRELKTLPDALVLLLDEPTAGLDPESADAFCNLLRSLHHELGLTVVMVTHDLDTLFELSTRVAVVADQRIIVNAPPREVIAFPKNNKGADLMAHSPCQIDHKQLREVYVQSTWKDPKLAQEKGDAEAK